MATAEWRWRGAGGVPCASTFNQLAVWSGSSCGPPRHSIADRSSSQRSPSGWLGAVRPPCTNMLLLRAAATWPIRSTGLGPGYQTTTLMIYVRRSLHLAMIASAAPHLEILRTEFLITLPARHPCETFWMQGESQGSPQKAGAQFFTSDSETRLAKVRGLYLQAFMSCHVRIHVAPLMSTSRRVPRHKWYMSTSFSRRCAPGPP